MTREGAEKVREAQESAAAELKSMRESNAEAAQLVKQCEAAYQITTTKGLAGAFDQRAGRRWNRQAAGQAITVTGPGQAAARPGPYPRAARRSAACPARGAGPGVPSPDWPG